MNYFRLRALIYLFDSKEMRASPITPTSRRRQPIIDNGYSESLFRNGCVNWKKAPAQPLMGLSTDSPKTLRVTKTEGGDATPECE